VFFDERVALGREWATLTPKERENLSEIEAAANGT
jgi:hypothetical protein